MPIRPGGSLQAQRHNSETDAGVHTAVPDGVATNPVAEDDQGEVSGSARRSRMRSLSNTLGDLFRSTKRVRREAGDEEEREQGQEQEPQQERPEERISRVDSTERDS